MKIKSETENMEVFYNRLGLELEFIRNYLLSLRNPDMFKTKKVNDKLSTLEDKLSSLQSNLEDLMPNYDWASVDVFYGNSIVVMPYVLDMRKKMLELAQFKSQKIENLIFYFMKETYDIVKGKKANEIQKLCVDWAFENNLGKKIQNSNIDELCKMFVDNNYDLSVFEVNDYDEK